MPCALVHFFATLLLTQEMGLVHSARYINFDAPIGLHLA